MGNPIDLYNVDIKKIKDSLIDKGTMYHHFEILPCRK